MDKNFRVSFDFDSCLTEEIIQKVAKIFLMTGTEVFIITSRNNKSFENNIDLFNLAHILGIKEENIHFTNSEVKWKKVLELDINLHFDDMEHEVHLINANGGCALLYNFDVEMTKWLFDDMEKGLLQVNKINPNKIQ